MASPDLPLGGLAKLTHKFRALIPAPSTAAIPLAEPEPEHPYLQRDRRGISLSRGASVFDTHYPRL